MVRKCQGVTKRCRQSLLTNSALVIRVRMRGEGGNCGVSANEYSFAHHVTWSPNKLWRATVPPYFTYGYSTPIQYCWWVLSDVTALQNNCPLPAYNYTPPYCVIWTGNGNQKVLYSTLWQIHPNAMALSKQMIHYSALSWCILIQGRQVITFFFFFKGTVQRDRSGRN
jgi:hypothetical protein